MVVNAYNPALRRLWWVDQEFKASLSYIISLRSAWATK
jgi:hypothetical protein